MNGGTLMLAEMSEQVRVLGRLAERYDADVQRVRAVVPEPLAGVAFLARGSSDHAAVFGRYLAELAAQRPAGLVAPSLHTLYRARSDYSGYLVVAVSQSGATPEIVAVCKLLRAAGARTVGIVNEPQGPLAEAVDVVLSVDAGPELAVPATKTATGQMLAVAAVAGALGPVRFSGEQLDALPGKVAGVLEDTAPALALARRWVEADRVFVVARGLLYAAALEAALKIKEVTGILAEGISAADFRHGPIGAVGSDVPVLAFDGGGAASDDVRELVRLVRARHAPVALCAALPAADLPLPEGVPEPLAAIPAVVRGQQVALTLADLRGLDPDAPAGLSKVTATN